MNSGCGKSNIQVRVQQWHRLHTDCLARAAMGRVFKRRRHDALTPLQMLQVLSELKLTAVLQNSCFWVAVDAATASLLDRCCTGQQDGGPATALEVADIVQAWQASQGGKGQPQPRAQQEQQQQQQGGPPAQQQQGEQEEPACASGFMPGPAGGSTGAAARPHQATDGNAEGGSVQGAASQSDPATGGGGAAAGALRSGEAAGAGPSEGEGTAAAAAAAPGAGAAAAAAPAAPAVAAAASEAGAASATPAADAGAGAAAAAAASGAVAAPVRASGPVAIRLSLEETFFLKYTLRCLTAIRAPGSTGGAATGVVPSELTEQGLWEACRSIRPNFPVSYAGYHHMKCKGWLPRSGLLYGVDYVLYQMHPLAVHSEFGVMLVPLSGPYRPDLNWLDVQITNRLINQVSKRLVLLYLHESADSPGHDTPACLDHFTAEERLLRRWVPSSTR